MSTAPQCAGKRVSDHKAISGLWTRTEKRRHEKLIAAKAVLKHPEKYGGDASAVVASARFAVPNDVERRKAAL